MKVQILSGVEGAQQATGITVVIDVLRAATVAAYLLDQGVQTITPVATKEEAFSYKDADPNLVLVGEEKGVKIPDFDIGNSPFEIKKTKNLKGRHVVHRSSTGTQGLVNSHQATKVIFGSFVTASAICGYILSEKPKQVSLVSMEGYEDDLFAEFLKGMILGKKTLTMPEILKKLEKHPGCQWFLDPDKPLFPSEDFYLSLELDSFSFFPIVHNDKIIKSNEAKKD